MTGWIVMAALWVGGMLFVGTVSGSAPVWQPLCVGLVAVAAAAAWVRVGGRGTLVPAGLLLLGLLYAISYAGVSSAHLASRNRRHVDVAERVASFIEKPYPVVCTEDVPRAVCFCISHLLDRPLGAARPSDGAYYLIGSKAIGSSEGAAGAEQALGSAGGLYVWEIIPDSVLPSGPHFGRGQ
jgi:hypothetical protein